MLFMITYEFHPEVRDQAQDRLKKTGGLPGPGVKMTGRWHSLDGRRGFILAESTDTVAIGKWIHDWTDLLTFTIAPVATDDEVMKVIG
jgi:hypothetical protein